MLNRSSLQSNNGNILCAVLCVVTIILAYNYWSLSQSSAALGQKLVYFEQKQLDFNGVAEECKKRIIELHDKISLLTSDKEVLATQKNSLFELAQMRFKQSAECKEREEAQNKEIDELKLKISEISDLQKQIKTLLTENDDLKAKVSGLSNSRDDTSNKKKEDVADTAAKNAEIFTTDSA